MGDRQKKFRAYDQRWSLVGLCLVRLLIIFNIQRGINHTFRPPGCLYNWLRCYEWIRFVNNPLSTTNKIFPISYCQPVAVWRTFMPAPLSLGTLFNTRTFESFSEPVGWHGISFMLDFHHFCELGRIRYF
jgi:hypothetical protein